MSLDAEPTYQLSKTGVQFKKDGMYISVRSIDSDLIYTTKYFDIGMSQETTATS